MSQPVRIKTSSRELVDSSTTALGISGVFTGLSFSIVDHSRVVAFLRSDQSSATNGVEFQQSDDGVTWFTTDKASYTTAAGEGSRFEWVCALKFGRVRLTNGVTPQTALLLNVYRAAER